MSWPWVSFYSLLLHLLTCLISSFLCYFSDSEWCIYFGNLYGKSLVLYLLKIFAKTLLFLLIFIVWFFLDLSFLYRLLFFAVSGNISFLVIFETLPNFSFFLLCSAFLCHIFILVVVEALQLLIFKVLIGPSYVYWLSLSTVCYSSTYLIIMVSFGRFVPLSDWCYYHLLLLEWVWHDYW